MKHRSRPSVKRSQLLIGAAVIALLIAAAACWHWQSRRDVSVASAPSGQAARAADYPTEIRAALKDYEAFRSGTADASVVSARREKLLSLTVPKEYKDVHLKLVMAADMMVMPERKAQADRLLSDISSQYPLTKE